MQEIAPAQYDKTEQLVRAALAETHASPTEITRLMDYLTASDEEMPMHSSFFDLRRVGEPFSALIARLDTVDGRAAIVREWRVLYGVRPEWPLEGGLMASSTRDARVVAAVSCPLCGAGPGERCKNPVAHQAHRGPQNHRSQPMRPHNERRLAWSNAKRGIE